MITDLALALSHHSKKDLGSAALGIFFVVIGYLVLKNLGDD